MSSIAAGLLMIGGTAFMLVAAIGLLRLPDLYTRMHAVTKAGTLGIGLVLISAAVAFGDVSVTTRALVALLFVLFTAPVSAHMIGRAGYLGGVTLWDGSSFDDWQAGYDDLRREGEEGL
jgi:multicomponent Na+:H+ antiporter subunit G